MRNKKRIVITEEQAQNVISGIMCEAFGGIYPLNPYAVLFVKKYLDKHFSPDEITEIDADGRIRYNRVGNWMDKSGNILEQPSLEKIVRMLDSEQSIRPLIKDNKTREKFLECVVLAWYEKRITPEGIVKGVSYIKV